MIRRIFFVATLAALPAAASAQAFNPPWTANVVGSSQPGLQSYPLFFWNGFGGQTFDSSSTLRLDRDVETDPSAQGGQAGYTYKSLWTLTTTGYNEQGYEWSITGELHNRTRKSTGAQHVAVNGTSFKEKTDNGEETSTTWAGNFNCVDNTGVQNPTSSCVGVEVDIGGGVGTDANRQRVGLHIAGGGQSGAHVGIGMMLSPSANVVIDRGILFHPGGGLYGVGIDTSEAQFQVAPIRLGNNQSIVLDSAAQHGIAYAGGDFMFWGTGGSVFRVNDAGRLYASYIVEAAPQPPASSSSACPLDQNGQQQVGAHAWDASFEYRCVAANHWKRVALSDF